MQGGFPERFFTSVVAFLRASTWDDTRQVLEAHREELLCPPAAEMLSIYAQSEEFAEWIYPGMPRARRERLLKSQVILLARCRMVGVDRAFDEIQGG
ncbi:hypothetical protein ACIBEJ_24375 [Nonomuraea sp. NPDC050790]|uniref:hypothetical protein n=1 Tax=Nonomuraea sp. NPDC050790 TaxID=3364371 RepID=UPI00379C2683